MFEKVKGFIDDHKDVIMLGVDCGIAMALYASCYIVGADMGTRLGNMLVKSLAKNEEKKKVDFEPSEVIVHSFKLN